MARARSHAAAAVCALACIVSHVAAVHALDALPRHATAGVFDQLVWIRSANETESRVFVTTEAREILASQDSGRTLVDITAKLHGSDELDEAPVVITGRLDEMGNAASESRVIIQDASGEKFWATSDLGATWMQPCGYETAHDSNGCFAKPGAEYGEVLTYVRMHDKRPAALLVLVKTCNAFNKPADKSERDCRVSRLMASENFGKSWVDLLENSKGKIASFVDFDWAPDDGKSAHPPIYATVFEDGKAFDHATGGWDYNVNFVISSDLFKTHRVVERCANAFEVINDDIYTASPPDCESYHRAPAKHEGQITDVVLKISTDAGASFVESCFPIDLPKNGFVIYDFHAETRGPDFIAIDHVEEDATQAEAPMNELYASDESMNFFSLSMRRNVRARNGLALSDFVNVLGLEGIYIANQINWKAFADPVSVNNGDYSRFFETRITYNAGGVWHRLAPPPSSEQCGRLDDCERWGLHLHGPTDWSASEDWGSRFGGVYSRSSAPGVIISTGNVGMSLEHNDVTRVNTYISRDGGVSWEETKRGPYIFEFGNHGGMLVIAKQFVQVNELEYSINEGKTWESLPLATPITVHNIRVDPSSKGHVFIIHGETAATPWEDEQRGSHFVVDFDQVIADGKKCDKSKDYEMWTPSPPGSDGCLMGQKLKLERKLRDALCFNDAEYERHREVVGTCKCSRAHDTECQYGSERVYNVANATEWPHCEPIENLNTQCPALKGARHITSSHLRIPSGDVCTDPHSALGSDDTGGRSHHHSFFMRFMHFIMSCTVLGGVGFAVVYGVKHYELAEHIPNGVRNTINGAYDKLQETFGRREQRPAGYFEPLGDFAAEDEI
jgi:sortilin